MIVNSFLCVPSQALGSSVRIGVSLIALMAAFMATPAYADGGATSAGAAPGGADSVLGTGGNGASDLSSGSTSQYRGGGGGGAGAVGGAGGRGYGNGAAAAAGGAIAGASGSNGASAGNEAGGGGGGGAHGFVGTLPTSASVGCNGGHGGTSGSSGGGGGGAGGYGAVVTGNGVVANAMTGGNGGNGGSGFSMGSGGSGGVGLLVQGSTALIISSGTTVTGGNGGSTQDGQGIFGTGGSGGTGGAAVDVRTPGLVLLNQGTIVGGIGSIGGNGGPGIPNGPPGTGPRYSGTDGAGGVGITGSGLTLTNTGSITGGMGYVGRTRTQANAITFVGGVNALTVTASSSIVDRVDAFSTADTFGLGGTVNASFALGQMGAANSASAQFRGFGTLEKSGTSTWTISGTAGAPLAYRVLDGTLDLNGTTQTATSLLLTGGALQNGTVSSSGAFDLRQGAVRANLSGSGSLTKSTSGTVTLSGTNDYSGATTLNGGTLEINSSAAIGNGSSTNLLVFNGATLRATDAVSSPAARAVSMQGAGTIDSNGHTVDLAGNITGVGSLTKTGTGTLTLSGDNVAYAGAITVSAGTLNVQHASALGSSGAGTTINTGAALELQGNIAVGAEALSISGVGVAGNGALRNVSGTNSYAGTISLASDTRIVSSSGSLALSGNIDGDSTGRILTLGGAGSGTLSGNIGGNVDGVVLDGSGVWSLLGDNAYAGTTTIGAGTLQVNSSTALGDGTSGNAIVFDGGTLKALADLTSPAARGVVLQDDGTIDTNGYSMVLDGTLSGVGSLTKTGLGNLTLGGASSYLGPTAVNAGTLSVNGSIMAPVTVNVGGTLNGIGTVGEVTVQSGGRLGAGNSIGTLNVAGPLALNGSAVLDVEVWSGGDIAGVHNDLVAVTGVATIASTASVLVRPTSGAETGTTYAPDTRYTILSAAGGRLGTFGSISDQFAFLDASLDYDVNNVYMVLKRNDLNFASTGQTANQNAVAAALTDFPTGDPVKTAILNLTTDEVSRAFDLASGDANASGLSAIDSSFAVFDQVLVANKPGNTGAVLSYIDAGPGHVGSLGTPHAIDAPLLPNALWLSPLAGRGTIASGGNGPAADWTTGGLAAGYESHSVVAGGATTLGLGAGYFVTQVAMPSRLATARAEGGKIGVYGEWSKGPVLLSGRLSYGASAVTTSRDIVIGAINRTASADYWLHNVGVEVQGSYGFSLSDTLSVGPIAGMNVGWSGHNGYAETGAGALNATVGATSLWSAVSQLGVGFNYALEGENGSFNLKGRALWLHDWSETAATPSLALAGGGGTFSVSSPSVGRDRLELGAGLAWTLNGSTTLSADYTGRFLGGQSDHVISAGISVRF